MSGLLELAERVERASGPDRELDRDIHEAIGNLVDRSCLVSWISEDEIPAYSASLGAALSLVPENALWEVHCTERLFWAEVSIKLEDGWWSDEGSVIAATPVLALTAAALKARAHEARDG